MLTFDLLRDRAILIVRPAGPLTQADFQRISSEVDPFIVSHGNLRGIMIEAERFPGWDSFAALASHFRFVADHHEKIKRVAVVTDAELLKILPRIADHFVQAEVKQFDYGQTEQALAWIEGS